MLRTIREIWANVAVKDKRYISLALWIMGIMGLLAIFILPRLFAMRAPFHWLEFPDGSGNVASTINGIAAPFIAFAAAILTFLAFWVQYQSNIQQKQIFDAELAKKTADDQARDKIWRTERFENRLYELLRLHKSNISEMDMGGRVSGRKCFVCMFYELRYIYKYTEHILEQTPSLMPASSPTGGGDGFDLLSFVYKIFFYGIAPDAERHFVQRFRNGEGPLYQEVKKHLLHLQEEYQHKRKISPDKEYHTLPGMAGHGPADLAVSCYYLPFDGHIEWLAHYLRHLYQVGQFIITRNFIDENEKYGYIKVLRSQLSNYEQLIIYYNSQAWFREEWRSLFVDYRLIKNLPLPLADFAVTPDVYFKDDVKRLWEDKGVHLFEWDE